MSGIGQLGASRRAQKGGCKSNQAAIPRNLTLQLAAKPPYRYQNKPPTAARQSRLWERRGINTSIRDKASA